ncbi:MAG: diguanylate cyclase [Nitrospiria bacterium]
MDRRGPQWFPGMTVRHRLIAAFVAWAVLVLGVAGAYVAIRLDAITTGLSPARLTQLQDMFSGFLWLALGLFLATLAFGVYMSRSILQPLSALARAVREVRPGAAHLPLPPVLARESDLWELTQAFDQMAHALGERDAQLQQTLRERERQIDELAAISRFAEGCAQFQNAEELYRHLTRQMAEAVTAEVCFILLYEKGANEMVPQLPGHGLADEVVASIRYTVTPEIRSAWDFKAQGALLCNDPQSDQRIVQKLIKPLGLYNLLVVPFYFQGRVAGVIVAANKPRWLTHEDSRLLSVFASHTSIAVANLRLYQEIQQLATRDGLTGLYNYRYFRAQIERAVQQARRYGYPLSLLMLDIDNFKTYNDAYGHLKGDLILKEIAGLLTAHTRAADLVARYGGEEFVILLPEIGQESAQNVAEKIRQVIEEYPFALEAGELPKTLTSSIGVASSPGAWSADGLIQHADQALYRAKEAGKNRVIASRAPHA